METDLFCNMPLGLLKHPGDHKILPVEFNDRYRGVPQVKPAHLWVGDIQQLAQKSKAKALVGELCHTLVG